VLEVFSLGLPIHFFGRLRRGPFWVNRVGSRDIHIITGLRATSEMPICWRRAGRDDPNVADAIIERPAADWSSSALTPRLISAKLAPASRGGREPSPTDPARARWRCESRMRPMGKLSGRVLHDGGANDDQSAISTCFDRVRGARHETHAQFAERLSGAILA
jgi:hypothetical protein